MNMREPIAFAELTHDMTSSFYFFARAQVIYEFIAEFDEHKPGEVIVREANDRSADFSVTGTRGLGKFRKTLLGSVSDFVLRHAKCPVLVCRSEKDFAPKPIE